MADNKWRRYQPPGEQRRNEDGQRVVPATPKPTPSKPKPTPKRPASSTRKSSRSSSGAKKSTDDGTGAAAKIVVGVMLALVIVVIAIVIAAVNNGDEDGSDYDASDVDLETLDVAFIQRGLDNAAAFKPDGQPFTVSLDEYSLSVRYYDPNAEKVQDVETTTYNDDGYDVRVGDNYYDEFQPRPFDLAEVQPEGLIAAVEAALEATDRPRSWDAEMTANRNTGELTIAATATSEDFDTVTVVAEPDGTVISTETS